MKPFNHAWMLLKNHDDYIRLDAQLRELHRQQGELIKELQAWQSLGDFERASEAQEQIKYLQTYIEHLGKEIENLDMRIEDEYGSIEANPQELFEDSRWDPRSWGTQTPSKLTPERQQQLNGWKE